MADEPDGTPAVVAKPAAATVDVTALAKENAKLAADLTASQAKVVDLEKSAATLTVANEQLVAKSTGTETGLAQLQQQVVALEGQVVNLTTEKGQVIEQLATATKDNGSLVAQQAVFAKIAKEYPTAIGMFEDAAKLAATSTDPTVAMEAIESMLKTHVATVGAANTAAITALQSGAVVGANTTNTPAQATGPKDIAEAHKNLQGLSPLHNRAEYAANMNFIIAAQENGTQSPN